MRATRRCVAGLGLALLAGACGLPAQTSQPDAWAPAAVLAELADERINEASGLVASRRNPGCYYVHNDSGDAPRVFLIDRQGRTRLTIRLVGARAIDYEDIALAPGAAPGTLDVCVADIGDNLARRPHVTIYRFPEVALAGDDGGTVEVRPTVHHVRYAGGPADAEALVVHPRTGDGYILTKVPDGPAAVYKLAAPWPAGPVAEAPRVATVALPAVLAPLRTITAADLAPDGRRLAVRCYVDGWEWCLPEGTPDAAFERIFERAPVRITLPLEPQGEALAYAADGAALLTVSEGVRPALYELRRAVPAGGCGPG